MVEPYQALGLVPTMRGIRHRDEIQVNIQHLSHLIKAASWLASSIVTGPSTVTYL